MAPSYPPPPAPRRPSPYPPPQRTHAAPKSHRKAIWIGGAAIFLAGLIIGAFVFAKDATPVPVSAAVVPTESVTVTESVTITTKPQATATITVSATPTPSPTPRTTSRQTGVPQPDEDGPRRSIDPGEPCSPEGAIGFSNGRLYTCEGPGQPRWRR